MPSLLCHSSVSLAFLPDYTKFEEEDQPVHRVGTWFLALKVSLRVQRRCVVHKLCCELVGISLKLKYSTVGRLFVQDEW